MELKSCQRSIPFQYICKYALLKSISAQAHMGNIQFTDHEIDNERTDHDHIHAKINDTRCFLSFLFCRPDKCGMDLREFIHIKTEFCFSFQFTGPVELMCDHISERIEGSAGS